MRQTPDWMPITPKTGSLFHAETQLVAPSSALEQRNLGPYWKGNEIGDRVILLSLLVAPSCSKSEDATDLLIATRPLTT
jgi:hypothetical protein